MLKSYKMKINFHTIIISLFILFILGVILHHQSFIIYCDIDNNSDGTGGSGIPVLWRIYLSAGFFAVSLIWGAAMASYWVVSTLVSPKESNKDSIKNPTETLDLNKDSSTSNSTGDSSGNDSNSGE